MTTTRFASYLLCAALCAPLLRAQEPSPFVMGVQARGSLPLAGLADAVGGDRLPGLGLSIFAETEWEYGYKSRVALGGDYWVKGDWKEEPGVQGQVSVLHLDIEGVKMLRPGSANNSGPYFVAGLGGYAWSVKRSDKIANESKTRRIIHLGGTLGFGYSIRNRVEVEIRGFGGRIDPGLFAASLQVGLTFRF